MKHGLVGSTTEYEYTMKVEAVWSQYSYSVAMAFPCSGFIIQCVIRYVSALQLGILSLPVTKATTASIMR